MKKTTAKNGPRVLKHRSWTYNRIQVETPGNQIEKAFADEWEKVNERTPWYNYGFGALQNLFFTGEPNNFRRPPRCQHVMNNRESMIAATVVQWMGTNCGMGFLACALRRAGYKIERIPESNPKEWVNE